MEENMNEVLHTFVHNHGTTISEEEQSFLVPAICSTSQSHPPAGLYGQNLTLPHREKKDWNRGNRGREVKLDPNFNNSSLSGLSSKVLHIWKWIYGVLQGNDVFKFQTTLDCHKCQTEAQLLSSSRPP
jgi:hypothetical protein